MNTPVRKIDILNLRPGEILKPAYPSRRNRRREFPKGNNRKITKSRKKTHISVYSYEYDSEGKKIKSSKKLLKFFRLLII